IEDEGHVDPQIGDLDRGAALGGLDGLVAARVVVEVLADEGRHHRREGVLLGPRGQLDGAHDGNWVGTAAALFTSARDDSTKRIIVGRWPFRRSSLPCIVAAIGSSRPSMTSFHTA